METSKFFSNWDLDFNRYKPMWYAVEVDVPVIADRSASCSITLNNQPFLMYRLTHAIVGPTYDWQTTGWYQDDQYSIEFKDENSNYQNIPMMSALQFGSAREGRYPDFAIPLAYSGNRTLTFNVTNRYLRVLTPQSDYFRVSICVHGVADWGPLQTQVR